MQVALKVGDLVRHTNIPSFGAGLIVGRKKGSAGVFVQWLDPRKSTCRTSMEIDLMLEVINENR